MSRVQTEGKRQVRLINDNTLVALALPTQLAAQGYACASDEIWNHSY